MNRLSTLFLLGTLGTACAAEIPDPEPDPVPLPPPVVVPEPNRPGETSDPKPDSETPEWGDDGIRDPGESGTVPPRPGEEPDRAPQPTGDDGIRDPGEADAVEPRPGAQPDDAEPDQDLGGDGIRDPGESGARPRPGTTAPPPSVPGG